MHDLSGEGRFKVNFAYWLEEAPVTMIAEAVMALTFELVRRDLPGWLEVARANEILDDYVNGSRG